MMPSMDQQHRRASDKNLKVHFVEPPINEVYPVIHCENLGSSSSSDSSLELGDRDNSHNNLSPGTEYYVIESQISTSSSEASSPSPVWSVQSGTITPVTHSPPIQGMGGPAGYDPGRIPLSIFSSKPSTPTEWSVASNESLFSINIGNTSLSRDSFVTLNKSGELPKLDEWISISGPLPPLMEVMNGERAHPDMEKHLRSGATSSENIDTNEPHHPDLTGISVGSPQLVSYETAEDRRKENMSSRISYRSDASSLSTRSFEFPVMGSEDRGYSWATPEAEKQQPPKPVQENIRKPTSTWFSCWTYCCCFCYRESFRM